MCLTAISLILKRTTNTPSGRRAHISLARPLSQHAGCFTLSLCNAVKDVLARRARPCLDYTLEQ